MSVRDRFLPGHGHAHHRARLVVCGYGDWWDFLYAQRDDACPQHGYEASRLPDEGTTVTGPCRGCGAEAIVEEYGQERHDRSDLRCPRCKETR
ncbi:hypothetical protein [Paractinoplanes deccanensis]|uniref:hypothetical protein n=1 Tax=Paractinoplanes deccanensis TaxID=113561 RepID=UPI001944D54E|nr:hypothetical protein [Actinoplanes deccanensis]